MISLVVTWLSTAAVAGVRWYQRLPGPTIESPTEGSPGFAGFVATFALALAIVLLAVSFTRRMRRAAHRERLREQAGQTDAVADGGAAATTPVDGGAAASPSAVTPADGGPADPAPGAGGDPT